MSFAEATIVATKRWSSTLYSFTIETPLPLSFTPGQYTRLAIEIDGKLIARPYSIANAPGSRYLEFFLIEVNDGPLSHRLNQARVGDTLLVDNQAHGFLVLTETPPVPHMWLLATGTGIAPFLSMVREGSIFTRHQRVVLVHSARHVADLAYTDELHAFTQQHPLFRFVQLVSRDTPPAGCLAGRITTTLDDGSLEQAAGLQLSNDTSHLMLCGNPAMIEDTLQQLKARGMQRHRRRQPGHITLEKFW